MQCRDFREIADSYLSDELLVETNHEVLTHLEDCAACRRELAARRELRSRLRSAFANAPELGIDKQFAARLGAHLRATALDEVKAPITRGGVWLTAMAACLLVAATIGGIVVWKQQNASVSSVATTDSKRENAIESARSPEPRAAVNTVLVGMNKIAAGDHRNCAVKYNLAEAPISLEEAGHKFDRVYLNLEEAVKSRIGSDSGIQVVEAHACVFEGRRFAHVVMKHRGRLVSLLVTDLTRSSTQGQATAESSPQQQVISCSEAVGYQVSCFETARHAVFIVSDLSESENLAVARALAPSVSEHIARTESLA